MLALQPRTDATTAAARNGGSAAKVRLQTRGDADRSRTDNQDIGPPRFAFRHVYHFPLGEGRLWQRDRRLLARAAGTNDRR